MKKSIKNVIIITSISVAAAFLIGCGIAGNMSSERDSEKTTPAEFKLGETEGKIAILVHQPGWIKTPMDLRIILTAAINESLKTKEKAEIDAERLIEYKNVLEARMALPEDKRDEPNAIAAKLGAKYVLDIQIVDFELSTFAEKNFFNGVMVTKACLLDANGIKLWPEEKDPRLSKTEIEDDKGTIQSSIAKLSAATAHCVTRYFYNCKTANFRVVEENKELDNYDF